ncbi:hypothetical protein D3C71_1433040 [compost metagenome]
MVECVRCDKRCAARNGAVDRNFRSVFLLDQLSESFNSQLGADIVFHMVIFVIHIRLRVNPADRNALDFGPAGDISGDVIDMGTGDVICSVQDRWKHLCGSQLAGVLHIDSFFSEKAFFLGNYPWGGGAVDLGVGLDRVDLLAGLGRVETCALQIREPGSALDANSFLRLTEIAANSDTSDHHEGDHRYNYPFLFASCHFFTLLIYSF